MNEDSYCQVDKDVVYKLCRRAYKYFEVETAREIDELVTGYQKRWNNRWWIRLFKIDPMGYDTVKAKLKKISKGTMFGGEYWCAEHRYSNWQNSVSDIVRVCNMSTNQNVYLSATDVKNLTHFRHLLEEEQKNGA